MDPFSAMIGAGTQPAVPEGLTLEEKLISFWKGVGLSHPLARWAVCSGLIAGGLHLLKPRSMYTADGKMRQMKGLSYSEQSTYVYMPLVALIGGMLLSQYP